MQLSILSQSSKPSIKLQAVKTSEFTSWLAKQSEAVKNCLRVNDFKAAPHSFCPVYDAQGYLQQIIVGIEDAPNIWSLAHLPMQLPVGVYDLDQTNAGLDREQLALGWALAAYQYTRYKKAKRDAAQLLVKNVDLSIIQHQVEAIYFVRDLINTPSQDLMPKDLAQAAQTMAEKFSADINLIVGDDLLKENYPTIHAVGRGSDFAPHLINLRWGDPSHKKLTLVGKGVCFDSGGLDIKTASGMLDMKKDMGGAAHALGLAWMIMATNLPINLRVLVPAVENAISGRAYHPSDIITTRQGLTVEVLNTDAEGRLILCDALTEASDEKPDLLIDFATLTGAARVALGTEICGLFCNHDALAYDITQLSKSLQDWIWPMPLYEAYTDLLKSQIADLANANIKSPWGGAIIAALYLQNFVDKDIPWMHFDIMAANEQSKPGRPAGGEAQGLRTLFNYLSQQWV